MNSAKKSANNLVKNTAENVFKFSGLALISLLSQNLYAASTIAAPEEIVIVGINDQAVKSGFLKKSKDYKVNPGPLSLSLRYQAYFEDNLNRHDIVKSDILRLDIPQIQDNQRYVLKLVNPPQDHDDAKKYAEQPKIALFDQNNQQVVQESRISNQPKNSILGGLFNDSVDLTQVQSTPTNYSSKETRQNQNSKASTSYQTSPIPHTDTLSVDQNMIQLWQKASKAERQKFMTWLAEQ
ncbi:DUF2057 family protein [Acinetobacter sp. TGL-Y2]|uniref:DUF2057 family protein n=1 Tax=Acinetobacter sp. TGL-Y2 TaxID=1407071 RepID=UPI0009D71B22|nr:DUF2057 family protein [Acinetobacter sp. TGL-Y2]